MPPSHDLSIGIDFGTSNTVVAIADPNGRVEALTFAHGGERPEGLCDGPVLLGRAARQRPAHPRRGRPLGHRPVPGRAPCPPLHPVVQDLCGERHLQGDPHLPRALRLRGPSERLPAHPRAPWRGASRLGRPQRRRRPAGAVRRLQSRRRARHAALPGRLRPARGGAGPLCLRAGGGGFLLCPAARSRCHRARGGFRRRHQRLLGDALLEGRRRAAGRAAWATRASALPGTPSITGSSTRSSRPASARAGSTAPWTRSCRSRTTTTPTSRAGTSSR